MNSRLQADRLTMVNLSGPAGGKLQATLAQMNRHEWQYQPKPEGTATLYTEKHRDRGAVHLFDSNTKSHLTIDLLDGDVKLRAHDGTDTVLHKIRRRYDKTTGWLVTSVDLTSEFDGGGQFVQTGPQTWTRSYRDGRSVMQYREILRGDWSVWLESAGKRTIIDLHNRRVVAPFRDGYRHVAEIARASHKINAWLVSQIDCSAGGALPTNRYFQTTETTWVEESLTDGTELRTLREVNRDMWTVYLFDEAAKVSVHLDLFTRWMSEKPQGKPKKRVSGIVATSILPRLGARDARTVNWVSVGTKRSIIYSLRQVSDTAWIHDENRRPNIQEYLEVARDTSAVHLLGKTSGKWLILDIPTMTLTSHEPGTAPAPAPGPGGHVHYASGRPSGWLTNSVTYRTDEQIAGNLHQCGWDSWVEELNDTAKTLHHLDEQGRTGTTITLYDMRREMTIRIDLRRGVIERWRDGQKPSIAHGVAHAIRRPEVWRTDHRIASRSALAEEYEPNPAGPEPLKTPVYRTVVNLPRHVVKADVWASQEVRLTINGGEHLVDNVRFARIDPSALSRLTITMPAGEMGCPRIFVRTNLMRQDQTHVILPDVEVHKKIRALHPDAMWQARGELGLNTALRKDHVAAVQRAMQNISATAQHTYNKTSHGIHHDRVLYPGNMEHPHFMLDFAGGPSYQPLSKAAVIGHTRGSRLHVTGPGQGFFDDIFHAISKAAQIVVHTAETVSHDIIETTEHIGHDLEKTVQRVGEDLVHGDILHAGDDLLKGGESIGSDLRKGAQDAVGDLVDGAKRVIVVTVKAVEDIGGIGGIVQYVLDHTGPIGKFLGAVLQKAGAAIGAAIGWLMDKLGFHQITATHDRIFGLVEDGLGKAHTAIAHAREKADVVFSSISHFVDKEMDQALDAFGVERIAPPQQPHEAHSGAMEKLEWFFNKIVSVEHDIQQVAQGAAGIGGGGGPDLMTQMEQLMDQVSDDKLGAHTGFQAAKEHIRRLFTNPSLAPTQLLGAVIEVVRALAKLALEVVNALVDGLLDAVGAMIDGFRTLITHKLELPIISDLYRQLTGRDLSVLGIFSMLVAIPTTILHTAITGRPPFAKASAGQALTPIGADNTALHMTYGCCQMAMSITSVIHGVTSISEVETAERSALKAAGNKKAPYLKSDNSNASLATAVMMTGGDLVLGAIAQFTGGAPMPVHKGFATPAPSANNDVFAAADYFSHIIWYYQWAGLGLDALLQFGPSIAKVRNVTIPPALDKGVCVLTFLRGIGHFGLMCGLSGRDEARGRLISGKMSDPAFRTRMTQHPDQAQQELDHAAGTGHVIYAPAREGVSSAQWLAVQQNFWVWRDQMKGNILKTTGNLLDTVPEIAMLGSHDDLVADSYGISLGVEAVLDVVAHLGEGSIYVARTGQDQIV